MLGIREKLTFGFGGLLLIMVVIGINSISLLTTLGYSVDVILTENYRSVIACERIKEALERMDSAALFTLLGETDQGRELIARNEPVFEAALQTELSNITLPGELQKAEHLRALFTQYRVALQKVVDATLSPDTRREAYFVTTLPLFYKMGATAEEILHMNQQNMLDANARARNTASAAKRRMYILLLSGGFLAVLFFLFTGRWILRPINRLIRSVDEIGRGNLDLVVPAESKDEIGRLSAAFNEMASSLRQFRRSSQTKMALIQRSTRQVFKSLPDAVVIVDLNGQVEVSTQTAFECFGLKPGVSIRNLPDRIVRLFDEALISKRPVEPLGRHAIIQQFIKGEEHFFRPGVFPILDGEKDPTGVTLVLKDVTQQLHHDELKGGVISTVSHQLKTPLTSLRMAVYLLLEEKVGPLTPKQTELLIAARDESDRLHSILNNLLDISRIESGKMQMDFLPVSPRAIVMEQLDAFQSAAKDRGVTLRMDVPNELPEVLADPLRIGHVLSNLLSNALKYTAPGGEVCVSAKSDGEEVAFAVSDTGKGIGPEYLDRIFEQFFRIPGQPFEAGEGLGLAIAKDIIEVHGGSIGAESEEGKGSTFTFTLGKAGDANRKAGSK
ncbi:MAG: HAMP domain-containing protein [Desulfobacteraceae bacterium]|nr:HAMP domain-containing protein [Desulfobacteraceae bacterium]